MNFDDIRWLAENYLEAWELDGWTFIFYDSAKSNYGKCWHVKKQIGLNSKYARHADEENITDTLLHEVAHALNWVRHGRTGHDWSWHQICHEVGCRAEQFVGEDDQIVIREGGVLECWFCGHEDWSFTRKPRNRRRCPDCGETLEWRRT